MMSDSNDAPNYSDDSDESIDVWDLKVSKKGKRKLCIDSDDEQSENEASEEDDSDGSSSSDEEDENDGIICPICLGEFTNQMVAIPENCLHMFCSDCIQEWTKKVNNCPVDRKKFNSISILLTKDGPVVEELHIEDKVVDDAEFEEPPTYCQVCGLCDREESLLLCDECDDGYHTECLDPPLQSIPLDEWYCIACRPHKVIEERTRQERIRNNSDNVAGSSEYIGNESDLIKLFERTPALSTSNVQARGLMFGQLARPRARTVAERVGGIGRGGGQISGRGSSSSSRGASNSRSLSSSKGKKRKISSKRKKKKTKKQITSSSTSMEVKKSLEKARKRFLKEQIKKFREKISHGPEEDHHISHGVSLFGKQHDLDAFYGDPEETYRMQEQKRSPLRSTITNTTDVVGSILGGYDTLDPDKVVVQRDGSLKDKKAIERQVNSKSCFSSVDTVIDKNKKRRKIRFLEEEKEVDRKQTNDKVDSHDQKLIFDKTESNTKLKIEKSERNNEINVNALKEIMRRKHMEKMEEKAKAEKFERDCKSMRENTKTPHKKTIALIDSVSNFKIPKRKRAENVCIEQQSEKNCEHLSEKNVIKKKIKKPETIKRKSESIKNDTYKNLSDSKSATNSVHLSLETRIKLYKEGKLKSSLKRKQIKKEEISYQSTPVGHSQKPRTISKHSNDNEVRKYESSTITKRVSFIKDSHTPNDSHIQKSLLSESTHAKKPISIQDYKKRKVFQEVFGDADLEDSLNTKEQHQHVPNTKNKNMGSKEMKSSNDHVTSSKQKNVSVVTAAGTGTKSLNNKMSNKKLTKVGAINIENNSSNNRVSTLKHANVSSKIHNNNIPQLIITSSKSSSSPSNTIVSAMNNPQMTNHQITNDSNVFKKKMAQVLTSPSYGEIISKRDSSSSNKKEKPQSSVAIPSCETIVTSMQNSPFSFMKNDKRNIPVAVVSPSPRHNFMEHSLNNGCVTTEPSHESKVSVKEGVIDNTKSDNTVYLSKQSANQSNNDTTSSCIDNNVKSASTSMLKELNLLVDKKENRNKQKSDTLEQQDLIAKIKRFLKPYYSKQMISKEDWKIVMKRAVKKVTAHMEYYSQDGKIEMLLGEYIKPYLCS